MVFRRRNPMSLAQRAKALVWPERGWHRAGRYIAHRLGRLPGTPYRIAAGFACGAAVSFTPFIGLHFLLAAGICLLIRGNLIASAIGTVVGNPWTFPFIWAWIYTLGRWMLGAGAADELPSGLTIAYIFDRPWEVLVPMMVGGAPTALAAWVAVYFPVRSVDAQYQKARRRRLRRKVRARRGRAAAQFRKAQEASRAAAPEPESGERAEARP